MPVNPTIQVHVQKIFTMALTEDEDGLNLVHLIIKITTNFEEFNLMLKYWKFSYKNSKGYFLYVVFFKITQNGNAFIWFLIFFN